MNSNEIPLVDKEWTFCTPVSVSHELTLDTASFSTYISPSGNSQETSKLQPLAASTQQRLRHECTSQEKGTEQGHHA